MIRWTLRIILVCFLLWLAHKRKQAEEEEDDDEDGEAEQEQEDEACTYSHYGKSRGKGYGKDRNYPRMPPTSSGVRNRRPVDNFPSGGGHQPHSASLSPDFDSIISKLSKPKDQWEGQGQQQALSKSLPPLLPPISQPARPKLKESLKQPGSKANRSKTEDTVLNAHSRPITHITFNREGNMLFTCAKDKIVYSWSIPDGECLGKFEGHGGAVWSCDVTKESSYLVTCGADQKAIVWDAKSPSRLAEAELSGVAKCVAWAQSGARDSNIERFASCNNKFGSKPAAITVWQFSGDSATEALSIKELPAAASQVAWACEDAYIASCHENGSIVFWAADSGESVEVLNAHQGAVGWAHFNLDFDLMLTCGKADMKLNLWRVSSGGAPNCKLLRSHTSDRALNSAALLPSLTCQEVLPEAPCPDKTTPCQLITGGGQDARDVALVGNNTSGQFEALLFRAGASTPDGLTSYGPEAAVRGHFGPIHTVAFSPAGGLYASGSEDGCVRLHVILPPGSGDEAANAVVDKTNSEETPTAKNTPSPPGQKSNADANAISLEAVPEPKSER